MRAAIVRSGGPGEAHHCETHDPITGVAQEEARRVKETDTMAKRDRHDVENTCRQSDVLRSRARVGASGAMRLSPPNRADSASKRGAAHEAEKPLTKHTHERHTRKTHTKHTHDTRKRPLVQPRARERSSRFCFSAKVTSDHTHSEAAITRAAETRACVWR